MFKLATTMLTLILLSHTGFSQDKCNCCTVAHQQFDFWIGDWNVFDTTGTQVGENTISHLEDNCILSEYWRGISGTTGRSYNYYNQQDSTWNQVWVDNNGGNLVLKGKGKPGKMVLKSELIPGKKIAFYYNQVTWTLNKDGSVTQLWEIYDQTGKLLSTAFLGIYKKKSS